MTLEIPFKGIVLVVVYSLFSGCRTSVAPAIPAASIASVTQDRNAVNGPFQFAIILNRPALQEVSIHYSTVAGTALANTDYLPASGMLTIPAGQMSASLTVEVTGDSTRKNNQVFYVQLDSPRNCTLTVDKGTGTIVNEKGIYFPVDNAGYATADHHDGYILVWRDEFTGRVIDLGNWSFETGNANGWGNQELENYTGRSQNAFVSNGNLIIEARLEMLNGNSYTSARMITKGKRSFSHGRIDIRAKMPSGKGIWPALWLLGDNIDQVGWPVCGEIDMMELLGQQPNTMYGTLHWGSNVSSHQSKGTNFVLSDGSFSQQFHVFSMNWEANSINLYVDDQLYFTATPQDVPGNYPFDKNFFFIFNVAVGGNWPGSPDATTLFPQRMIVDYVRVFQK